MIAIGSSKTTLAVAILCGVAGAGASQVGCSSGAGPSAAGTGAQGSVVGTTASGGNGGSVGTLGLSLSLPGGDQIQSVTYTLTDSSGDLVSPAGANPGTVSVTNSASIDFQIGGVPTGSGDTIALQATTVAGASCAGSDTGIVISPRGTTNVVVQLVCVSPGADAGNVFVSASAAACGTWTGLASGSTGTEVFVGESITLDVAATGPDPIHLGYTWTATTPDGGVIGTLGTVQDESAGPSDSTTFLCTAPGTATVTVVVDDGPLPDGGSCPSNLSTVSTPVICDPSP